MNLPSAPDLSVYQLALKISPSQSLKISLTTLKSLVGAVFDVLIEEKIPATLWVKLPPKEGWQAELKQYQQQVSPAQKIYLCNGYNPDHIEPTESLEKTTNTNRDFQFLCVQLATKHLQQEYFLLVLAEQFSCLIVAANVDQPELTVTALPSTEPLLAVCSFEAEVIQQVWEGISRAIVITSLPKNLLEPMPAKFSQFSAVNEKTLLTQLLVKQVQRTEAMRHSSTTAIECHNTATAIGDSLSDKDELLRRVAQELRTPLASMKTALKLLDSPQLKPPQRQRYMQLLNTECDRQNSLLTGLLELVQLGDHTQTSVMPSVQLADIVPGIVSTYQPIAQEKGIQLGYTVPTDLPLVLCLETWLRQIVINLLNNSLKFTPSGGHVRVRATLQGEYVQLAISDTGIGIAVNDIPKIFDGFYRGRSATGEDMGAGLGLTIVQRLLLRCGGSISVTSKLGEGSTFKALLSVAP